MDRRDRSEDQQKDINKLGDDEMAVIEKELKDMHKTQSKRRKVTREELKMALLQQTLKDNYEAIKRLARS